MWWRGNKGKILLLVACILALAVAFWCGKGTPAQVDGSMERVGSFVSPIPTAPLPEPTPDEPEPSEIPSQPTPSILPLRQPNAVESRPAPTEVATADKDPVCTLSIHCTAALARMDTLPEAQQALIPQDGVILAPTAVSFDDGESVFDLLQRVCREQEIHMEFSDTPIYHCAYVEGIQNLYELDFGALSGWMYQVNGQFPNYSCSQYTVEDGDVICWLYTCDLGQDIGGQDAAGQRGE